jgi:hypothetical protein
MGVHTHNTAGFTIFPTFVALVHKNPYVGHYLSCRRFGKEPPRRPLTRPHLPSVFLFFLLCHFVFRERHTMMARGYGRFYRLWCCHPRCDRCRFITTPLVMPPRLGFVRIDGGGENYLPFHQPHSGDFMPYANHQQIWPVEIACGAATPDAIVAASSTHHCPKRVGSFGSSTRFLMRNE